MTQKLTKIIQDGSSKWHRSTSGSVSITPITPSARAKRLWEAARIRALERNLAFSISKDWILQRLLIGRCEVTGLEFRTETGVKRGRNNFAPSIDRIVPSSGYTEENARIVVWIYNAAKGDGRDEDVLLMAAALVHTEAQAAERRMAATQAPEVMSNLRRLT